MAAALVARPSSSSTSSSFPTMVNQQHLEGSSSGAQQPIYGGGSGGGGNGAGCSSLSSSSSTSQAPWGQAGTMMPSYFPSSASGSATAFSFDPAAIGKHTPSQRAQQTAFPSPQKPRGPPRDSTDALARWFAELACWLWFSPPSSSLGGASIPGTPCRSPTSTFAPLHPSPLAPAAAVRSRSHSKTKSHDFASLAPLAPLSPSSSRSLRGPLQPLELDDRLYAASQEAPAIEHLRLNPRQRFVTFVRDALRTTQLSTSVLILALLYIRRLKLLHPRLRGQDGSEYRLCVTALMLGNKFLDDHTYTNKTWADISGMPLKDVTKMEVEFWLGLQMSIYVSKQEYEDWQRTLEDLYEQRRQALAKRARDQAARRRQQATVAQAAAHARPTAFYNLPQAQAQAPHNFVPAPLTFPGRSARHSFSHLPWPAPQPASADSPPSLLSLGSSSSAMPPFDVQSSQSSISPTSQRSYASTAPTSISPLIPGPSHEVYKWPSPVEAREPSGCLRLQDSAAPHWQHQQASAPFPFKRRREESVERSQGERSGKRAAVASGAMGRRSPMDTISPPGIAGARSVFAQPLTPDRLMQAYAGPHGLASQHQQFPSSSSRPSQQHDRPLSFYQLAAGRDFGLPAFHYAPPTYPTPPTFQPAASTQRRGSLSYSGYGVSPRTATPLGAHLGHAPNPHAQASGMHPPRLSPEAYGLSYGRPAPVAPHASGLPSSHLSSQHPSPATGAGDGSKRCWMPFNNVPMDMQLQHLQQWQQMHYWPHLSSQQQQQQQPDATGMARAASSTGMPRPTASAAAAATMRGRGY